MFSVRKIEFADIEGTRWSRIVDGVLYVFDLVRPFTTLRGEFIPGRLMVDRFDEGMQEWRTVHVLPV
ncbi:hypothetical protein [Streptomyces scopuliridis]|uniref:Uncharacterized protein n=1 Tax=Streptomyces scopuliridis TaxID=452529 RepID=A0ACD4ZTB0_9ACTN|nr:hypothetical protein [Streptomyces scopuliridis]WSC01262.1 hypothetical protein OG835_32535 [Streptomyces scopuliridis]